MHSDEMTARNDMIGLPASVPFPAPFIVKLAPRPARSKQKAEPPCVLARSDRPSRVISLKIHHLVPRRHRPGDERIVRLRRRRSGIAKLVDDRIAAVAAETLQRHLHAWRRRAALVFGGI